MQLEYLSAKEIGNLVNTKEIKPIEVIKYFENRIEKRNKDINAFVYTKFDYAEQKALEIEDKIMHNEPVGPFAGVPFGLKDFLPNKIGWQSSHGGVECLISTDKYNSVFCEAMEKAGGIAIGKTNAPAYGFRGTTDNKLYGPTHNPFNLKYNSGGSSGGSAAAVADGLVPISEGGDAGGSIRLPASWCNLFGYKPGLGRVPSVCRPDAWSATHPFCFNFGLTKTVSDAKILLNYMSYYNSRDPYSLKADYLYPNDFVLRRKNRIAVTYDFNLFEIDPIVRKSVDDAILLFKDMGYEVEFVDFNFDYNVREIADAWCNSLMFDSVIEIELDKISGRDYLKEHPEQFPEELIYWKNRCQESNIWDLYKFNLIRTELLDQFENVFDNYAAIISPVSCCLPVENAVDGNTKGPAEINGKPLESLIGWAETFIVNFIGYPAASLPIGIYDDNRPLGIQLIGPRFGDPTVLKLSEVFESENPWKTNYKIAFDRKIS